MALDNPAIPIQQGWQAPTLLNAWVNFGSPYNPIGYWKDSFGVVHLRGVLANGTNNTTICTLPAGYRPPNREAIMTLWNSLTLGYGLGRVDIFPDGTVLCQTGPSSGATIAYFLDGMTFKTL